jgi:spermidine/putrescine transport system substrate-binding protein
MIRTLAFFAGLLVFAVAASHVAAQRTLNLFAWSEYVPQEVIDGFTNETGIKVNYEAYASNEEMLSKFLAVGGQYDLIQPSEYTVEALVKMRKLEPLDHAKLPNLKHIAPEFRGLGHDPELNYSVPWMGGTVGIVVNTQRVNEPIRGYNDVFQDKYAGRIVVVNDNREIVSWALSTLGLPINDITPEALQRARPVVARWVKLVKLFDSDSPKTALLNGDVDLGVVWSGEAAILYNHDRKFKYVLAAEGAHRFVDSLSIPSGARNRAAAHEFMNYVLRPEVSKLISAKFPYTNPNLEARKLLTREQLENPASYSAATKLEIFRDIGKQAAAIDRMMTDLRSGG